MLQKSCRLKFGSFVIFYFLSIFLIPLDAQVPKSFEESDFTFFRLQTISKGVYVAIAKDGAAGCNTGIIDNGDYLVLFDPFFSEEPAAELKKALKNIFPGISVRYVINSHWHEDHTKGNQYFKTGASIIGTEELRKNMISRYNPDKEKTRASLNADLVQYQRESDTTRNMAYKQEILEYWLPGIKAELNSLDNYQLTPPDLLFNDSLILTGKDFNIHIISYGRGHTSSDIILWLPHANTLFMGDLLFVQRHAWMGHGNYLDWIKYLNKLENKSARWLVPAHGPVSGTDAITELRAYFSEVENQARRFIQSNLAFDKTKVVIPEKYKNFWWAYIFPFNVKHVFDLIKTSNN